VPAEPRSKTDVSGRWGAQIFPLQASREKVVWWQVKISHLLPGTVPLLERGRIGTRETLHVLS